MNKPEPSTNSKPTSQPPETARLEHEVKSADEAPVGELFPERRPVDLNATPLVEDPTSRGRFSRRKRNAALIERIKAGENRPSTGHVEVTRRKLKSRKASGHADWDEDQASDAIQVRKGAPSRVGPWIAVGVLVVTVLLIATVSYKGLRASRQNDLASPPTTVPISDSAPIDHEEALRTITRFLAAQSVEELLACIRNPERVGPLVRQYYDRNPFEPVSYTAPLTLDGLSGDGDFLEIQVDTDRLEQRPLVLERVGNQYKADWECWVAYSEMSWDDFIERRLTEPRMFRVMIGPDIYYNHKFGDSLDYRCYQIQDQVGDHLIYGYVERGSEIAQVFEQAFRKFPYGCAMVKLQFPDDNPMDVQSNQVVISEFLRSGWVDRSGSP